ncbi:MAG TPA: hypothetical protein VGR35_13955 [Tepidisphaeraceae bacterium]|nr:hypothetical protein [Tepidisphaeraceae bacterium]
MPVNVPLIPFIRRRRRPKMVTPPAALMLVAAEYDSEVSVTLTFDRAIDVAGLVGSAIVVEDAGAGLRFEATGPVTIINPQTVRIGLGETGPSGTADNILNASAGSGIVAVDDGGMWAGVSDLVLPFP